MMFYGIGCKHFIAIKMLLGSFNPIIKDSVFIMPFIGTRTVEIIYTWYNMYLYLIQIYYTVLGLQLKRYKVINLKEVCVKWIIVYEV